jgi:hypothetical protein
MRTCHEIVDRGGVAYTVSTWDDETGDAEILEFDSRDSLLRRGVLTYWTQGTRDGEVVGSAVWFDANGVELERRPLRE